MELNLGSTVRAAVTARDALATAARRPDEHTMSEAARRALFDEAVLGALKARVTAWKSVAK